MKHTRQWRDDFIGHRIYSNTAGSNVGHNWKITKTAAGGTPTFAPVASTGRGLKVDCDAQNEAQNLCVSFADYLPFFISDLIDIRFRVLMNQAVLVTGDSFSLGLASARNDTIDTITYAALFRMIAATSTTLVVVETDDNVADNNLIATGKTLVNVAKDFVISFAAGIKDVRFLIDGQPVANSTKFDMSGTAAIYLQPFMQLQKTASANASGFTVLDVEVNWRE